MSGENLAQVFAANPITTNTNTDLMYFAKGGVDVGMTYANFAAQFPGKTGTGASGTWGINISGNAATATSAGSVPVSGITGLGTGVATALAINVGSPGAFVTFNGAGGTPSSINLTHGTVLPLTTGVTGILSTANGGTGLASPTANGILIGEGSSPVNPIVLTDGQILIGNSGSDPSAALLTAGSGITITPAGGSITISSSGGSGTPIAQELWVNTTNGNDSNSGTMPNNALQTWESGAYPIVLANASSSIPYVVYIIGNCQVATDFNLLPYCTIYVIGGLLNIIGTFQLDSSYATTNNAFSYFEGRVAASGSVNCAYGTGDNNFININIDPTSCASLTLSSDNSTANNYFWVNIIPNPNFFVEIFPSGITYTDVNVISNNIISSGPIIWGTTGSNPSYVFQNCTSYDSITATSSSGSVFFQLQNCSTNILTLDTTSVTGYIFDCQSYPFTSLNFTSGATISQISIVGGTSDGLPFSEYFTPSNFSLVTGAWPSSSITAAFAGIDAAISKTIAFPFTYDSGNSSGITGTPVIVFGTYTASGNFVTVNITVSLDASLSSAVLAFTAPLVSSFPIGNFISATGSIFTDTINGFGAIGLAGALSGTTSIAVPLSVTSVATDFYVSLSLSYQYQNF